MEADSQVLREQLVAMLGAGRELSPSTDDQLAEAFLRFMESQRQKPGGPASVPRELPHESRSLIMLAGGAWGAALMFLLLLGLLSQTPPMIFLIAAVLLLSLVAALTKALFFLARSGFQLPRLQITAEAPAARRTQGK